MTARLGRVLGICFGICFVTGLLSHYQYHPWTWLPEPASPVWGYRVTQGVHVATGMATIPLLLVKLWSVYPNLFRWPPVRRSSTRPSGCRCSCSSSLGPRPGLHRLLEHADWYPWPWGFVPVHRFLAYVVIGSILLHIGDQAARHQVRAAAEARDADVLTEVRVEDNPAAHSNAGAAAAAADAGAQPARPAGRDRRRHRHGRRHDVGRDAHAAVADRPARDPAGRQGPAGRAGEQDRDPGQVIARRRPRRTGGCTSSARSPSRYPAPTSARSPVPRRDLPIACVEGWSVGAHWRGIALLDLVRRAGGDADSHVQVVSLETGSQYAHSVIEGPQVAAALLATHLNGERLDSTTATRCG